MIRLLVFVATIATCSAVGELDKFLNLKFVNVSTWIKAENLNPSMVVHYSTTLRAFNNITHLDTTMWKRRVTGIQEAQDGFKVFSDLGNRKIEIYSASSANFSGEHWTSILDLRNNQNYTSVGLWYIQSPLLQQISIRFEETPNGYLNITEFGVRGRVFWAPNYGTKFFFENLLNEHYTRGYETEILQSVADGFNTLIGFNLDYPIHQIYRRYFQELFQETSLSAMISRKATRDSLISSPAFSKFIPKSFQDIIICPEETMVKFCAFSGW